MKIDFAELPNIRDLLDKLILDRHNCAHVADSDVEQFRVVSEGGTHAGELTKAELLSVFQARVDTGLKMLNSKYYIEFKNLDGSQPLPSIRTVDVTNADGPATAAADPDSLREAGAQ